MPSMTHEDFSRHLFSSTERLTRADASTLALRFSDGDGVSVPEFLDFIVSSSAVRRAKASASAVRVGLHLFELQQGEAGESKQSPVCGRTTRLQSAVRRLVAMWWAAPLPSTPISFG